MGVAIDSIVSAGCIISGGRVSRSVLSPGVRVNSYSEVDSSILYGERSNWTSQPRTARHHSPQCGENGVQRDRP